MRFLYLWFPLFFLFLEVYAQEIGKPFIRTILPKEYNAHAQNWSITQDQRGVMYIGNGDGIILHDGKTFDMLKTKGNQIARSMIMGEDNIIYVGSVGTFGYLSVDALGKIQYVELDTLLLEEDKDFKDVWQTHYWQKKIYYRTIDRVMIYQDGHLSVLRSEHIITHAFILNGSYHITTDKGIFFIDSQNKFQKIPNVFPNEDNFQVSYSLPYSSLSLLFFVENRGCFMYDLNMGLIAFPTEIDDMLKKHKVYSALWLSNGTMAIFTHGKGCFILSRTGKLIRTLQKMPDDIVYYGYEDREKNLWIATNKGVVKIDISSPLSFWNESDGLVGAVEAIIRHKEVMYIGTHRGVFYIENNQVKQVEGINDKSWSFINFTNPHNPQEEKLLVATNHGLVEIKDKKAIILFPMPKESYGFYEIALSKYDMRRIWMGFNNSIGSVYFKDNKWIFEGFIKGVEQNTRSIVEDAHGNLWIGTFRAGVFKITSPLSSPQIRHYTEKDGIPSLKNVLIFPYQHKLILGTEKGIVRYNTKADRFEYDHVFGERFTTEQKDVFAFIEDSSGKIWISGLFNAQSSLGFLAPKSEGGYTWHEQAFRKIPPMMMLALYKEPTGVVWTGGTEGLFRFDSQLDKNYDLPFKTLLRKVQIGEDSTLFYGNFREVAESQIRISHQQPSSSIPKIDYAYNTIRFEFAAPFFGEESSLEYSWYLEGFDSNWSNWAAKNDKEYTNLSAGNYFFRVKARNLYGVESEEMVYAFEVESPWYSSLWAILFYVVLGLGVLRLSIKYYTKRLEREKLVLERIIDRRTKEISQKNVELEQQKEEIYSQTEALKQANENMRIAHQQIVSKNVELEQQKEEIASQAENLKKLNRSVTEKNAQIEKTLKNIKVLSEIGQKITSTFDVETIITLVYENVNAIMDASGFGIGIHNPIKKSIDFRGFIEKGEVLPAHSDLLQDLSKPAARCFITQQIIFTNDLWNDYERLGFNSLDMDNVGDLPLSIIYVPLLIENRAIGVITVQSFEKNSYHQQHLDMLLTLASYASIALDNAHNYEEIRHHNTQIQDSIRYAQTIQNAILPTQEGFSKAFSEYFVLFRPKDLVSGDFYWFSHLKTQEGEKIFVSVSDCTGHGVPGAFMSMIGHALLNEIVNAKDIYDPALILETLDTSVRSALHQEETSNNDGMDISLCVMEKMENENILLKFAGAKRPLWFYKHKTSSFEQVEGVRRHIGGHSPKRRNFITHSIEFEKNDVIYLFSDGICDQADPQGQKFGKSRLKDLLLPIVDKKMSEQLSIVEQEIKDFAQGTPQRDDVTVLGLRV